MSQRESVFECLNQPTSGVVKNDHEVLVQVIRTVFMTNGCPLSHSAAEKMIRWPGDHFNTPTLQYVVAIVPHYLRFVSTLPVVFPLCRTITTPVDRSLFIFIVNSKYSILQRILNLRHGGNTCLGLRRLREPLQSHPLADRHKLRTTQTTHAYCPIQDNPSHYTPKQYIYADDGTVETTGKRKGNKEKCSIGYAG